MLLWVCTGAATHCMPLETPIYVVVGICCHSKACLKPCVCIGVMVPCHCICTEVHLLCRGPLWLPDIGGSRSLVKALV